VSATARKMESAKKAKISGQTPPKHSNTIREKKAEPDPKGCAQLRCLRKTKWGAGEKTVSPFPDWAARIREQTKKRAN